MGRKLDALLGRNHRTSKLKTTINHAISRLSLLKNQRHARFNISRSDTIQLLHLNHHQQALVRVEQVIKDQNMLDVYDMIDTYCHLLKQRINLIEQANDCPQELKEAASSLVYAAPRCREFPELQEIRAILTTCFGNEFAYGSINLKGNCGVGQTMIQKLSPKESSYELRMTTLTKIAKENGIVLQVDNLMPEIIKDKLIIEKKPNQLNKIETALTNKSEKGLSLSESMKERSKYKDVADAAQDAFKSAARTAEELACSESFKSQSEMGYEIKSPTSRYDSESDYDEITEEIDDERSKNNLKDEEFGDLYSENYSDEEDFEKKIVFHENERTGDPSRNAYFSSYKQFPIRPQVNLKTGLSR